MVRREIQEQLDTDTGCVGHSADDEPLFVLCARDTFAAARVREWADQVEFVATNQGKMTKDLREKIAEARKIAMAMDAWPTKKLPD